MDNEYVVVVFVTVRVRFEADVGVPVLLDDDDATAPTLVGIFVFGVPSSLIKEAEDNCLDPIFEVLAVRVDRVDDAIFVADGNLLDGVRRPSEVESELSESAVEPLRTFVEL